MWRIKYDSISHHYHYLCQSRHIPNISSLIISLHSIPILISYTWAEIRPKKGKLFIAQIQVLPANHISRTVHAVYFHQNSLRQKCALCSIQYTKWKRLDDDDDDDHNSNIKSLAFRFFAQNVAVFWCIGFVGRPASCEIYNIIIPYRLVKFVLVIFLGRRSICKAITYPEKCLYLL